MDIEKLKKERSSWLKWKNIAPLREKLKNLPDIKNITYAIEDSIKIFSPDIQENQKNDVLRLAQELKPWRKGPYNIFDIFIDSEWQSQIKYNLLEPYFDIKNKKVADIGCNNGYYMFRMLRENPKKIVGFDPSPLFKTQFDFINHFIKSDIKYEFLGVEHLEFYGEKFDTVFCLGVLYHRSDPVSTLKSLKKGLNKGGELILDTFMIDGDKEYALSPNGKYSKIPNIYFVPTIPCLKNWLQRAGFTKIDILEIKKTDAKEQRQTKWIQGESLGDFLDSANPELTIEGYPAPKRVYTKASF